MVDPAKHLHRNRRQSDLIAHGVAVRASEKRYIPLLDIVGVRDGSGPVRRTKRLEPGVGVMFCEQLFGRAPGRDILHGFSPFSILASSLRFALQFCHPG
jgi:hypothetical protein